MELEDVADLGKSCGVERTNGVAASGHPPLTSMRSTFRNISSTLSSMRSGATCSGHAIDLEAEGEVSEVKVFAATRMDWTTVDGRRILVIADAEAEARRVSMRTKPFAKGGFRVVSHATESLGSASTEAGHRGEEGEEGDEREEGQEGQEGDEREEGQEGQEGEEWEEGQEGQEGEEWEEGQEDREDDHRTIRRLVVKESMREVPYEDRLQFHKATTQCQERATHYAQKFNAAVAGMGVMPIEFIKCDVYRLSDPTTMGNYRFVSVEPYLEGEYIKHNTNNGYVRGSSWTEDEDSSKAIAADAPQAFTHFSFHASDRREMIVDLQGVEAKEEVIGWSAARRVFRFTDPQVHSVDLLYGQGDRGDRGFGDFLRTHRCGPVCKMLRLDETCPVSSYKATTATTTTAYGHGPRQREAAPYGSVSKEINRKIRDGEAPPLRNNADVRAFAKGEYEAAGRSGSEIECRMAQKDAGHIVAKAMGGTNSNSNYMWEDRRANNTHAMAPVNQSAAFRAGRK